MNLRPDTYIMFREDASIFVQFVPSVRLSRVNRPTVTQRFFKNYFVRLLRDRGTTGNVLLTTLPIA